MKDKLVRLSEPSWRKVRAAAYTQETNMKTVLEGIINEKFPPFETSVTKSMKPGYLQEI